MNVSIIVLNIFLSIKSKFSVENKKNRFSSSGAHSVTQSGADSVTDRICPICSDSLEFVHAAVPLAPRRSRTPGGHPRRPARASLPPRGHELGDWTLLVTWCGCAMPVGVALAGGILAMGGGIEKHKITHKLVRKFAVGFTLHTQSPSHLEVSKLVSWRLTEDVRKFGARIKSGCHFL